MKTRRVLMLVAGAALVGLLTGCDWIDALLDGGVGGSDRPSAAIHAEIADGLVTAGLNPDLRPPLMYAFSVEDSLDSDGIPITVSPRTFDYSWDFGNGATLGPGGYPSPCNLFLEQGTYDVTLTLTQWGAGTDAVTKRIVIGESWLEIMEITWLPRSDGNRTVSVAVRNQSRQALRSLAVRLKVDGDPVAQLVGGYAAGEVSDRLLPGGGFV